MSDPTPLDFVTELPRSHDSTLPDDSQLYWLEFNDGVAAARQYLGAALRPFVGDGTPSVELDEVLLARSARSRPTSTPMTLPQTTTRPEASRR